MWLEHGTFLHFYADECWNRHDPILPRPQCSVLHLRVQLPFPRCIHIPFNDSCGLSKSEDNCLDCFLVLASVFANQPQPSSPIYALSATFSDFRRETKTVSPNFLFLYCNGVNSDFKLSMKAESDLILRGQLLYLVTAASTHTTPSSNFGLLFKFFKLTKSSAALAFTEASSTAKLGGA